MNATPTSYANDGHGRNCPAFSDFSQAFVGFKFDADHFCAYLQNTGYPGLYLIPERGERGLLTDQNGIYLYNLHLFPNGYLSGSFQQLQTGNSFPPGVGVRKMNSDIPGSYCTQYCVGNGVTEHVSVAMTQRPFGKRNFYPGNDQRSSFNQAVDIGTDSYSHKS